MDELLYWSGRRMLLDEYLQGDLTPNRLPPTWVSRSKFVFQSDDGGLAVLDTANDSVNILVTNHTLVMFVYKRKKNARVYTGKILFLFFFFAHRGNLT